ncbi:LysR substrate-binding domain-containing protein [Oceanospirillum sp.]|uniref:LysR substrate-binding domain-containing protein n=1 Tax=Oceanospirillum sp. TaxID=2021254 RepID=UPI003A919D78
MPKYLPSLRALQIFSVAARLGSFKHASQQLFITPQAVSLQIKSLEDQLGLKLFERKPSGIVITNSGQQLLDYVERGLALMQRGVDEVCGQHHRPVIRVSSSPWFAVNCLLPRLSEFEAAYPDCLVQVSTSVAFPDFEAQGLDLAIQWGFGEWGFESQQLLLTDDKLIVCAPELPKRIPLSQAGDLIYHRLLCTPLSVPLWGRVLDILKVDAAVDQQVLPLDSHAGLLEAANRGLGVAMISTGDALDGIAAGRLVAPLGEQPISRLNPALMPGYWLAHKEIAPENARVKAFIDWMQDWLQDHPRAVRVNLY